MCGQEIFLDCFCLKMFNFEHNREIMHLDLVQILSEAFKPPVKMSLKQPYKAQLFSFSSSFILF